jgi:hypothetical protein
MPAGPSPVRPDLAVIVACAALVVLVPRAGHAYLDPGVASFAIQGFVGAIAAIAAGIGGYWRKILGLLRRRPADGRAGDADRGNRT